MSGSGQVTRSWVPRRGCSVVPARMRGHGPTGAILRTDLERGIVTTGRAGRLGRPERVLR